MSSIIDMKLLNDSLDYVLFFITSSQIVCALAKYALSQSYQYPFLGLALSQFPLALVGLGTILKFIYEFNGKGALFYLSLFEYLVLSAFYGMSQILWIWSLYYHHMTLIRYVVINGAVECVVLPVLSWFFLKRTIFLHYGISVVMAVAAVVLHEFVVFERTSSIADLTATTQTGWEGPVLAIISKILYLFGTVLSKKFILQRAHYYKLFEKQLYTQEIATGSANNAAGSLVNEGANNANSVNAHLGQGRDDNQSLQYFGAEKYYHKEANILDDKPRLLKKESCLFKRFQLIKKLDPNYEDLKLEDGRRDPYLENRLGEFRKLVGGNTVKVNQIVELPRNFTRPKFEFYLGYDGLSEEELDNLWNEQTFLLAEKNSNKIPDLKELRKWEVEHLIRQEDDERQYLEELLKDYIEMKLSCHLFHDKDDILLTKYDEIFDSMLYDSELINVDMPKTLEIHSLIAVATFVLSLFGAFFNLEFYYALHQKDDLSVTQQLQINYDYKDLYALFAISTVFVFLKPFVFNRVIQNHVSSTFFFIRILSEFSIVVFASTFTNDTPSLNTNVVIAIFLLFFAFYANYAGSNHRKEWAEFASLIEMAKTYFSNVLEVDQLLLLEIRLIQINQLLGRNEFLRILFDLIVSKNPRQLLHTSNPVLFMRKNFDIFYNRRAQNWGGGMPRPIVEGIESSWMSQDQKDMWINSLNMLRTNYDQEKKEYDILKNELVNGKKTQ